MEAKGKVVIVTGASSGIGEATAKEFARVGSKVVLAARRVDRLEAGGERFGGKSGPAPVDAGEVLVHDRVPGPIAVEARTFLRL